MLSPCIRSSVPNQIKSNLLSLAVRYLYGVRHDPGVFYVNLPVTKNEDRAVLLYKRTGTVLDMYAVQVPKKYEGQGLGRLLAEAAFTYVIVRDYRMYLSCTYLQRYYQKIKSQDLSVYVLGPPHILGGRYPVSMFPTTEADRLEGMPDPADTDNIFNKD